MEKEPRMVELRNQVGFYDSLVYNTSGKLIALIVKFSFPVFFCGHSAE